MSQVLGGIVGDVEQLPVLREHHQETGHGLKENEMKCSMSRLFIKKTETGLITRSQKN